jgi:hypothetical protein
MLSSPLEVLNRYSFSIIGHDEGRFWGFASLIEQFGSYSSFIAIYENPYYRTFGVVAFLNYILKVITGLSIDRVNNCYVITLNLLIFLLFYIILQRREINRLAMSIVLSSVFYQQISIILSFIPQTLSYVFLLTTIFVLFVFLNAEKFRIESLISVLLIAITSTITHPTAPFTLILILIYSTVIAWVIYKLNKGTKLSKFYIYTTLEITFTALIYWVYSAALNAIMGGGTLTISSILSSLRDILFRGSIEEPIKASVVWLSEMPSSTLYTETLLIAAVLFSSLRYVINILHGKQNREKDSFDYMIGGMILVTLTLYLIVLFSFTRRYFYVAFLLSPLILSDLLKQSKGSRPINREKRGEELSFKAIEKSLLPILLSFGIIAGMLLFSGIYVADRYIPLSGNVEWLIAGQIFRVIDNKLSFHIYSPPAGIYTDLRLAIPLSYYEPSYLFSEQKGSLILIGVKFDSKGNNFIDKYFSNEFKARLIERTYNLLGNWNGYYIITFN